MSMPSAQAVEIGYATAADVADIVSIMREGAAWMAAKGCPQWDVSALTPAMVSPLVAGSDFVAARVAGSLAGVCTLSSADPDFWPEDPPGFAAYIHKLAIRRAFAGGRVTRRLVGHCLEVAGEWRCKALRLDCHPILHPVYRGLGFSHVDTRNVTLGDGRILLVDRFEIRL